MSELIEAIHQHYHDTGSYPQVYVSESFFNRHGWELAKIAADMPVEVDNNQDWRLQ